jgi:hypothetical protein
MLRAQSTESASSQALDTGQLIMAARQKAIVVHSVLFLESSWLAVSERIQFSNDIEQTDFVPTIEGLNYRAC